MAIINMGLQAYSGAANHLMLAPMVSENGMTKFLVSQYAIQYAPAGTSVSTSSVASMALTPGATYRFMTGARLSDTAGGSTNMTCRAVIVIAKRQ